LSELEAKPDEVRRFLAEPLPIPPEHYLDAFLGELAVKYVNAYDHPQPSFLLLVSKGHTNLGMRRKSTIGSTILTRCAIRFPNFLRVIGCRSAAAVTKRWRNIFSPRTNAR